MRHHRKRADRDGWCSLCRQGIVAGQLIGATEDNGWCHLDCATRSQENVAMQTYPVTPVAVTDGLSWLRQRGRTLT